MGSVLSDLFVDLESLPQNGYGTVQLLFLMIVYAKVLMISSNWISDGSELLLLIPSVAGLVGSVVLPILGAVPDGAIVLFSGLGPRKEVASQIGVGVGALAGSTIMLITVPWFLSIYGGRVSIKEDGTGNYKKPRGAGSEWAKILPGQKETLRNVGVVPGPSIRTNAKLMLLTAIGYLIIQGQGFTYAKDPSSINEKADKHQKADHLASLLGLIFCVLAFVGYLVLQVRGQKENVEEGVLGDKMEELRKAAVQKKLMSVTGAFSSFLTDSTGDGGGDGRGDALLGTHDDRKRRRFKATLKGFFSKYDADGSGNIDEHELKTLLHDLGESPDDKELTALMAEMDKDGSGTIEFDEFAAVMQEYVRINAGLGGGSTRGKGGFSASRDVEANFERHGSNLYSAMAEARASASGAAAVKGGGGGGGGGGPANGHRESTGTLHAAASLRAGDEDDEEEEEEEEMPEDLADLPPDEQRRKIWLRALYGMGVGTLLVLLFSDPMVDCLSELGKRAGIPAFYVSFVLAPLASNASELIASMNYAKKKTTKTITIAFSSLEGAAIMNNTFCLGIFLALVYFVGIEWTFTAETLSILFIEICLFFFAYKKVQTMFDAWMILALFPISVAFVAILEGAAGIN